MRRAEHGFTVIEVLVALTVSAILLVIVIDGAAGARRRERAASLHADAARLGSAILSRAASSRTFGGEEGSEAGLHWRLTRTIVQSDPRGLFALAELKIAVRQQGGPVLESFVTRRIERIDRE